MAWYKTVTYRKTQVCANNTTELGRVISFCLTRKFFSTTVSNDLSRANQIDMTGPNSVVLFAQTLVCSLCNYYISLSLNVMLCYFIFGSMNPNYRKKFPTIFAFGVHAENILSLRISRRFFAAFCVFGP